MSLFSWFRTRDAVREAVLSPDVLESIMAAMEMRKALAPMEHKKRAEAELLATVKWARNHMQRHYPVVAKMRTLAKVETVGNA